MKRAFIGFFSVIAIGYSQLQVGDESPDFEAPICNNMPDGSDGTWSLYDEGAGKVIWLDLYTSW
tara:strand:+ start:63 stop:254 length:192 start_codon:yes stop_codon:yes gene_type:complete